MERGCSATSRNYLRRDLARFSPFQRPPRIGVQRPAFLDELARCEEIARYLKARSTQLFVTEFEEMGAWNHLASTSTLANCIGASPTSPPPFVTAISSALPCPSLPTHPQSVHGEGVAPFHPPFDIYNSAPEYRGLGGGPSFNVGPYALPPHVAPHGQVPPAHAHQPNDLDQQTESDEDLDLYWLSDSGDTYADEPCLVPAGYATGLENLREQQAISNAIAPLVNMKAKWEEEVRAREEAQKAQKAGAWQAHSAIINRVNMIQKRMLEKNQECVRSVEQALKIIQEKPTTAAARDAELQIVNNFLSIKPFDFLSQVVAEFTMDVDIGAVAQNGSKQVQPVPAPTHQAST